MTYFLKSSHQAALPIMQKYNLIKYIAIPLSSRWFQNSKMSDTEKFGDNFIIPNEILQYTQSNWCDLNLFEQKYIMQKKLVPV